MKNSTVYKIKFLLGNILLIAIGLLVSKLITLYSMDWIMYVAVIVFSIIYIKFFSSYPLEYLIVHKLSKQINFLSIIFIIAAVMMLPSSMNIVTGSYSPEILYFISFVLWCLGIYFIHLNGKYHMNNDNKDE